MNSLFYNHNKFNQISAFDQVALDPAAKVLIVLLVSRRETPCKFTAPLRKYRKGSNFNQHSLSISINIGYAIMHALLRNLNYIKHL